MSRPAIEIREEARSVRASDPTLRAHPAKAVWSSPKRDPTENPCAGAGFGAAQRDGRGCRSARARRHSCVRAAQSSFSPTGRSLSASAFYAASMRLFLPGGRLGIAGRKGHMLRTSAPSATARCGRGAGTGGVRPHRLLQRGFRRAGLGLGPGLFFRRLGGALPRRKQVFATLLCIRGLVQDADPDRSPPQLRPEFTAFADPSIGILMTILAVLFVKPVRGQHAYP